MLLAAWLHTLTPFVVRFTDDIGIRWYGLSYLAGFAIGYLILVRLVRRGLVLLPCENVDWAILWLISGLLVGGRLGYAAVYDPDLFRFSSSFPFWGLLAVYKGGMASHGGMVGVILAGIRVGMGRRDEAGRVIGRMPLLHMVDIAAVLCPVGLALGRVANFINGELLGRIVTGPGVEGPWWTVQFPQELDSPHAPELNQAQQQILFSLEAEHLVPGERVSEAQLLDRVIESARDHAAALKQILSSRHPSQLYQAAAEGIVVGAVVWLVWARPRKPGVVGASFLVSYGILRILTEVYRLPDAFADPRPYGLSRGQWLSVAMIVVGAVGGVVCARRPAPRIGGWLSRKAPPPPPHPEPA